MWERCFYKTNKDAVLCSVYQIICLEYGHMGYQTLCDTPTKKFVKKSGLCNLSTLRKVQKCVFSGYNFEKANFNIIFGLFWV